MTRVDNQYREKAREIIDRGYKESSVENAQVRARWDGDESAYAVYLPQQIITYAPGEVPLINLRKIAWKTAIKEILWIYQDRSNDVSLLKSKYNVNYWDSWTDENQTLGTAYGYQMNKAFRSPETGKEINQMDRVLEQLRDNPLNRRIFTTMMDMDDLAGMSLIPCAFMTMWTVTGDTLNMTLIQRSGDYLAAAGPGCINAFQYYVLLRMVAQVTGYKPGQFLHFIQNLHIYGKHIPTIEKIVAVDVEGKPEPKLLLNPAVKDFYDFTVDDFTLEDYDPDTTPYDIDIAI